MMQTIYIKYKNDQANAVTDCDDLDNIIIQYYMIRDANAKMILFKWCHYSRCWEEIEKAENVFVLDVDIDLEKYTEYVISELNLQNGEYRAIEDP